MAALLDDKREWDLPHLKEVIDVTHHVTVDAAKGNIHKKEVVNSVRPLHDVKFYPYTKPGVDPIFAVVGVQHILICRPSPHKDKPTEILHCIKDEENEPVLSSLVWTKDFETGAPLLCVAGGSAIIKIIDALTGKLRRTLQGHGGDINDLAVSPINPQILASASEDTTIRIWSLIPAHKEQPCVAMCAGEGHRDTILTIAFHPKGQYIISGGQDHIVNLWTLPVLPDSNTQLTKPLMVHFPHFSTSEVHSNIVDCVQFYHDLILSKALHENCIVLWLISGFDSSQPPPPSSSAPTTHDNQRDTRSSFSPPTPLPTASTQYIRLLQFDLPGCNEFYMRFSLYSPLYYSDPQPHPILAMCNSTSKVSFWDLDRLEEYYEYSESLKAYKAASSTSASRNAADVPVRPHWLVPFRSRKTQKDHLGRVRDLSPDSSSSQQTGSSDPSIISDAAASVEAWDRKYSMGDPQHGGSRKARKDTGLGQVKGKGKVRKSIGKVEVLNGVEAHRTETVPKFILTGRQVAWSAGGEWCVVVGNPSLIAVFWRWGEGTSHPKGR